MRVMFLLGSRRREIKNLFLRTADAFGYPAPPLERQSAKDLLRLYGRCTSRWAETALKEGTDLIPRNEFLFTVALELGRSYRIRMGLRTFREAMIAARIIYAGLGIRFRGYKDGRVEISRCFFSSIYTPRVCGLVSALDRGLLAGLTEGGELRFYRRITEGACSCRALLTGGTICRQ